MDVFAHITVPLSAFLSDKFYLSKDQKRGSGQVQLSFVKQLHPNSSRLQPLCSVCRIPPAFQ